MTTGERLKRKIKIKQNIPLFAMLLLPLLFFVIFSYVPMLGTVIAFKNYRFIDGIIGSEWVGLRNFEMIFSQKRTLEVIRNTFVLSVLSIVVAFPFPIVLAILLNEVRLKWFKKVTQTVFYLPHFFSWVIVGGIVINVFSVSNGPVSFLMQAFGAEPKQFLFDPTSWTAIFLGAGIWRDTGFSAIIYLAALTSIDPTYYEAAVVEGANKWQQITKVTIPCMVPIIVLTFILAIGNVMEVGFDKIFVLQNDMVRDVSEVVSTFVYNQGIRAGEFSLTTAMGLFESLVGLILVLTANQIAKRSGNALF